MTNDGVASPILVLPSGENVLSRYITRLVGEVVASWKVAGDELEACLDKDSWENRGVVCGMHEFLV